MVVVVCVGDNTVCVLFSLRKHCVRVVQIPDDHPEIEEFANLRVAGPDKKGAYDIVNKDFARQMLPVFDVLSRVERHKVAVSHAHHAREREHSQDCGGVARQQAPPAVVPNDPAELLPYWLGMRS